MKTIPPRRGYPRKYPFLTMKIGQDFLVKGAKERKDFEASLRYAAGKLGGRFETRTERGGVRVWRTR